MNRNIIIFIVIQFYFGCIVEKKNFYTKPSKIPTVNHNLRLDGNYIGMVRNNNGKEQYLVFCLYANGIALEYYSTDSSISMAKEGKEALAKEMKDKDSLYKVKQAGGYIVNGDKIEIQIFEFINYGKFEVATYRANIINDSVILITSCEMRSKSNICPSDVRLMFYKMEKPDSLNQLMEKAWYWRN